MLLDEWNCQRYRQSLKQLLNYLCAITHLSTLTHQHG
jgi:hypothetical protein